MKTILLCLLGNRDLQIHNDFTPSDHPLISRYFVPNNDGRHLIINKSYKAPFEFKEAAQDVLDHYEEMQDKVIFPMIEASLDYLEEKPDLLILSTSKQDPVFSQDCFALAEFADKFYRAKGFETHIDLCPENPTLMEPMLTYYNQLFDQWDQPDLMASQELMVAQEQEALEDQLDLMESQEPLAAQEFQEQEEQEDQLDLMESQEQPESQELERKSVV